MAGAEKYSFTFIDVETTGMAAFYDDRVCEIGVARCDGLELVSTWSSLVNPERPISYGAMNVHGISNEMVESAPKFKDVADEILKMISGAVVVCHNASFDLSFIKSEFARLGRDKELPGFNVMDTLKIARRYFNFPSNSLGNIAYNLHIELEQAHRALADAVATQKIFSYMIQELDKRGLEDIEKLFVGDYKAITDSCAETNRMIPMRSAELPPILEEALKSKARVRVRYLSSAGVETERILTPKEIIFRQDSAYLIAYCDLRREDRTFRLDRIIEIKIL